MDRIKSILRRVSIPAAFILCGIGCLLTALALTKVTVSAAKRNMTAIVSRYDEPADAVYGIYSAEPSPSDQTEERAQLVIVDGGGEVHVAALAPLNAPDRKKFDFYAHMDELAALWWYTVCLALFALLFYRWKIRRPYKALTEAVGKIAGNDLNFQMAFEGQDELGRLCRSFEVMRQALVWNNRRMWDAVEERKRLNAAFAHDLRTPLTVLRGHAEIIASELEGREDLVDVKASVREISCQIDRLASFVDTMGRIRKLEDYESSPGPLTAPELTDLLTKTARHLYPAATVEGPPDAGGLTLFTDREALTRIYENVLSNAARHARERVAVSFGAEGALIKIAVQDDGAGFTARDLENAACAYYRGERAGDDAHFGLGLYISSVLAKKLGGGLVLENASGGAKVTIKIQKVLSGI